MCSQSSEATLSAVLIEGLSAASPVARSVGYERYYSTMTTGFRQVVKMPLSVVAITHSLTEPFVLCNKTLLDLSSSDSWRDYVM